MPQRKDRRGSELIVYITFTPAYLPDSCTGDVCSLSRSAVGRHIVWWMLEDRNAWPGWIRIDQLSRVQPKLRLPSTPDLSIN